MDSVALTPVEDVDQDQELTPIEVPAVPLRTHQDRLRALFHEHADFVWRSLRRLGVSASDADDLVQEVFLVVHRKLHKFDGRSPRAWLYAVTRRVASTHRRAVRRGAARRKALAESEGGPDPEATTASRQRVQRVADVLDRLRPERREVFVMTHVEQMSAPEIADVLGVTVNVVYSRLRLARRDFAKYMEDE